MKPLHPRDMAEATRLTRSGRLSEAVALIQSVLRGSRAGANEPAANAASRRHRAVGAGARLHAADAPSVAGAPAAYAAERSCRGILGRLD